MDPNRQYYDEDDEGGGRPPSGGARPPPLNYNQGPPAGGYPQQGYPPQQGPGGGNYPPPPGGPGGYGPPPGAYPGPQGQAFPYPPQGGPGGPPPGPPPPPPPGSYAGAWGPGGGGAFGGGQRGPPRGPPPPAEGPGGDDSDGSDGASSTGPMNDPDEGGLREGPAASGELGYSTNVMDKKKLYGLWFMTADADRDGRITGKDAVNFFTFSGLTREVLARVWALADHGRSGFLDVDRFATAMDLITLAQEGNTLSMSFWKEVQAEGRKIKPPTGFPEIFADVDGEPVTLDDHLAATDMNSDAKSAARGAPSMARSHMTAMGAARSVAGGSKFGGGSMFGGGGGGGGGGGATPSAVALGHAKSEYGTSFYQQINYQEVYDAGAPKKGLFGKRRKEPLPQAICTSIVDGLKNLYFGRLRQIEHDFKFGSFFSPLLNEGDFEAKPNVLLLGQYSTGKTTFIKHLLGRTYPGAHIGPEPTTDRFVVVMHGFEERVTPGNTLAVQPDKPYQGLQMFGTGFLGRFQASQCPANLLEEITIVDTPGVLSGEKQRIERQYNFTEVCGWFAARADLILLLFDPYKLDISDEFKSVIQSLRGHDDKVRVVLNKADTADAQQLMRVYGALMWSLGKVFRSPEVCRVYLGSFNTEPIKDTCELKALLEKEQQDLLADLFSIPERSCDRKVNEFVKRVRALKIHVLIMGRLRDKMPALFGKKEKQRQMLNNLGEHFRKVQREHHLPAGDFPDTERYKEILESFDLTNFPKVDPRLVQILDNVLTKDIPGLIKQFDNPW